MRKWWVPFMVLGAGGVGAWLMTDRGRDTLRGWLAKLNSGPQHWYEWNEDALAELDQIQTSVNQVARSIEQTGQAAQ